MTHALRAKRYRKLADYIANKRAKDFSQQRWFCGSAACIAGHCSLMLGWKLDPHEHTGRMWLHKGKQAGYPDMILGRYLGLNERVMLDLTKSSAPWQFRDAAVAELRRRAKLEDAKAA
ncbi:MAG: hypothetical protein KGL39_13815 [Patescibacteria group bacterium]|nr:hypothetical protein [Patescibacteria group bacterium]